MAHDRHQAIAPIPQESHRHWRQKSLHDDKKCLQFRTVLHSRRVTSPQALALLREVVVCLAAGSCLPNRMEVLIDSSSARPCTSQLTHTCQMRMFYLHRNFWRWGYVGRIRICIVLIMFLVMLLCCMESTSALVGIDMCCTDVFCTPMLRLES